MEELLNKLIEKGWYPFCDNQVYQIRIYSDMDIECIYGKRKSDFYYTSYRKLTSKESGLWQFCCKNGMVARRWQGASWLGGEPENCFNYKDYEYWLIESALKDEEDLEKFLLDNIQLGK